jgi:DHA2 family multidrug resistance protein
MLQSLYGYTATDAGLVLGPGAFVIVALAPLIVRILPKVGIKPLIFTGYTIFAMAMWRYASIDLGTDYKHVALIRALQGLGIAPLFVPVSQLAYSFLPKNKNNKASRLTNLFRNQGGSCIASLPPFCPAHAVPSQCWSRTPPLDQLSRNSRHSIAVLCGARFHCSDAALHAQAQLARLIQQQTALLGFLDCFWLLGCACLIERLVFFTRKLGRLALAPH